MKLAWGSDGSGGFIASDEQGYRLFHVGRRGPNDIRQLTNHTRYCVFVHSTYDGYAGDLPLDLPEEDLKAAAITLARLSGYLS